MKVLFITHDGISHEPLGLMYLSASLLRAGHLTRACVQSRALIEIILWKPDYVAFQVLTGDQDRWGRVARQIKKDFPNIKTIFGGPHFLFFFKQNQEEADYIIRGDGEEAIIDVVEGRPWINLKAIEDLDSRAHPDRNLLYNDFFPLIKRNVIRNFISCRGCPYQCTYCYNSNKQWQEMTKGKRLRYHSPEWLIEDIEKTFTDFGGDFVSFQDDIFGINLDWLDRFTALYQRLRIPFFAQLRPRLITKDRVRLLKKAGVHIVSFAIESGNEQTRREILEREESNELIQKACNLLHKEGIKFRMQNLLALPVKDPLKDALETLSFNIKNNPTLSWCSLLQAYPGTNIANYVIKKGLVKSMDELLPMVNSTFFYECSLPIKDKKKIERLHKYWSAVVRWPWLYFIVRILINFNLGSKIQNYIFKKTKNYINGKEYWRVKDELVQHIAFQNLDRLGDELIKNKGKIV